MAAVRRAAAACSAAGAVAGCRAMRPLTPLCAVACTVAARRQLAAAAGVPPAPPAAPPPRTLLGSIPNALQALMNARRAKARRAPSGAARAAWEVTQAWLADAGALSNAEWDAVWRSTTPAPALAHHSHGSGARATATTTQVTSGGDEVDATDAPLHLPSAPPPLRVGAQVAAAATQQPFAVAALEWLAALPPSPGDVALERALQALLPGQRLADASVVAKAVIVCAAVHAGTRGGRRLLSPPWVAAVVRVFTATHGGELLQLKDAVNVAGAALDLHQLVFRDLPPAALPARYALLQHFGSEAARAAAHVSAYQVILDFDDTVQALWVDGRFPRGATYPGVTAFLHELRTAGGVAGVRRSDTCAGEARHAGALQPALQPGWWDAFVAGAPAAADTLFIRAPLAGDDDVADSDGSDAPLPPPPSPRRWWRRTANATSGAAAALPAAAPTSGTHTLPSSVVIVSARPAGYRGIMKRATLERLRHMRLGHVIVLLGSLLRSTSVAGMVAKKVENACLYMTLFPEARVVFIGDAGQGDAAVAAALAAAFPARLAGAFIHDVTPAAPRTGDGSDKAALAAAGVVVFNTYAAAGGAAAARGLLSHAAAARVAAAAVADAHALLAPLAASRGAPHPMLASITADAAAVTAAAAAAESKAAGSTEN